MTVYPQFAGHRGSSDHPAQRAGGAPIGSQSLSPTASLLRIPGFTTRSPPLVHRICDSDLRCRPSSQDESVVTARGTP